MVWEGVDVLVVEVDEGMGEERERTRGWWSVMDILWVWWRFGLVLWFGGSMSKK